MIATECGAAEASLRVVVNENWSNLLRIAHLDEFLPASATEDCALAELLGWP